MLCSPLVLLTFVCNNLVRSLNFILGGIFSCCWSSVLWWNSNCYLWVSPFMGPPTVLRDYWSGEYTGRLEELRGGGMIWLEEYAGLLYFNSSCHCTDDGVSRFLWYMCVCVEYIASYHRRHVYSVLKVCSEPLCSLVNCLLMALKYSTDSTYIHLAWNMFWKMWGVFKSSGMWYCIFGWAVQDCLTQKMKAVCSL